MGNILLVVIVLIVFAFGYFATYSFGKFMDEHFHGFQEPQDADSKVCITEAEEKKLNDNFKRSKHRAGLGSGLRRI